MHGASKLHSKAFDCDVQHLIARQHGLEFTWKCGPVKSDAHKRLSRVVRNPDLLRDVTRLSRTIRHKHEHALAVVNSPIEDPLPVDASRDFLIPPQLKSELDEILKDRQHPIPIISGVGYESV